MALKTMMLFLVISSYASAQVTQAQVQRRYPRTPEGAYILGPNVTVNAVFDEHRKACTFIVRGPTSVDQVLHYFNLLVPRNIRGSKGVERFMCVAVCEHVIVYSD